MFLNIQTVWFPTSLIKLYSLYQAQRSQVQMKLPDLLCIDSEAEVRAGEWKTKGMTEDETGEAHFNSFTCLVSVWIHQQTPNVCLNNEPVLISLLFMFALALALFSFSAKAPGVFPLLIGGFFFMAVTVGTLWVQFFLFQFTHQRGVLALRATLRESGLSSNPLKMVSHCCCILAAVKLNSNCTTRKKKTTSHLQLYTNTSKHLQCFISRFVIPHIS